MAILKTVTDAQKYMEKIIKDRNRDAGQAAEMIEAEGKKIIELDARMEAAAVSGNHEAFKKAKQEKQEAVEAKEMYERQLAALNEKPLISDEEYRRMVNGIFKDFNTRNAAAKDNLFRLSKEMLSIAKEMQTAINEANEVLYHLQHDLYHDADRLKGKNGACYNPSDKKEIKDYSAMRWGESATKNTWYQQYLE